MIFETEPFLHQKNALELSLKSLYFALFMEQGTGKTKTAIDTIANLYLQNEINAALIVAPSGVDYNWVYEEIPVHLLKTIDYQSFLYRSSKANNLRVKKSLDCFLKQSTNNLKILVMMPEALLTFLGNKTARDFLQSNTCIMIVDESGKVLKNHKAKRTKKLIELGAFAKYRRILTGTPITKSPLDLYTQFLFLHKQVLKHSSFYSFRNEFAELENSYIVGRSFKKISGYKNLDRLIELITPYSFRVLKKDCLDLPPKIYQKHFYTLNSEQKDLYATLKKDDIAYPGVPTSDVELINCVLQSGDVVLAENALKKLLRLQQIISGFVPVENGRVIKLYKNALENPRIVALNDVIATTEGKKIIWCRFVEEIKTLLELFGKKARGYFGQMTSDKKQAALFDFKKNAEVEFLICNTSMGYGWTANEATNVIYFSNDFNLQNRMQSEDRCHRSGQTESVFYTDIVCEHTVDEHILSVLKRKIQYSKLLDR